MFVPIYNKPRINNFIESKYSQLISYNDVVQKKAYKILRTNLKKIEYANYLYNIVGNKTEFIKKFFPNRFEELSNNGRGEFRTSAFFYRKEEDKVVWRVIQGDNERTFKLRTEDYYNKIESFYIKSLKEIKNTLDGFYGYFIEKNPDGTWYITDKNFHNGSYRKIAYKDTFFLHVNQNKFATKEEIRSFL